VTFNNGANSFSGNGAGLTLNANNLTSGTIPDGRIGGTYSAVVTFNNAGNSFSGNGAGLTLNANNLTSGVVPDGRLSANVAFLSSAPSFAGSVSTPAIYAGSHFAGSSAFADGVIELGNSGGDSINYRPYIDFHLGQNDPSQDFNIRIMNDTNGQLAFFRRNVGVAIARFAQSGISVNGGAFFTSCDKNLKEDFESIDSGEILEKVVGLPITRWKFKTDETRSAHLGPTAQDFHALFRLGMDDTHIATVDEAGVALAAIQGLNQKLEEKLRAQGEELKELRERLARLDALEAQLQRLSATPATGTSSH
jgi:hypothetical protein